MEGGLKRPAPAGIVVSPIQDLIDRLHESYCHVTTGAIATYIPELAAVAPDQLGIAIATAVGHVYAAGDSDATFTIQSISKPVLYGLALSCHGREAVLARIGVEPSGEAFNSTAFDEAHNRPFNAMVNAGAIVATSLVPGGDADERLARILEAHRAFVGHAVEIDDAVYRSEAATGHRNRAIAYLERNAGMLVGDVDEHLDLYFRQCAIRVSAADLALLGATLANGGTNPATCERALDAAHVRDVLSVMTSCGMYDYAGEWELRVGLPAKSGVGGGIVAVLPGQLGIGVFSPRLDEHGNSHCGLRICEELAQRLDLHMLSHRGAARPALRRRYRGAEVRSKRVRRAAARHMLDELGGSISVFELQGDLFFANTERIVRAALNDRAADHFIFDAKRVASLDHVAAELLRELADALIAAGKTTIFAAPPDDMRASLGLADVAFARDVDEALERCEEILLGGAGIERVDAVPPIPLAGFELLRDFAAGEIEELAACLARRSYETGATLIRDGAAADTLYFIEDGAVDIRIARDGGPGHVRLGAVEAGNVVGELALLGGAQRTAEVVAAAPVSVLELSAESFAALSRSHPAITGKLMIAIGRSLAARLRRANAEIGALTR
jgi:glutaminase